MSLSEFVDITMKKLRCNYGMYLLQKMKKKIFKKMMKGNSYSKMLYSVGYNKEKKQKTNLTYMLKCK